MFGFDAFSEAPFSALPDDAAGAVSLTGVQTAGSVGSVLAVVGPNAQLSGVQASGSVGTLTPVVEALVAYMLPLAQDDGVLPVRRIARVVSVRH